MFTKLCVNCKKEKPLEEFYIDKNKRVGRVGTCKKCFNGV